MAMLIVVVLFCKGIVTPPPKKKSLYKFSTDTSFFFSSEYFQSEICWICVCRTQDTWADYTYMQVCVHLTQVDSDIPPAHYLALFNNISKRSFIKKHTDVLPSDTWDSGASVTETSLRQKLHLICVYLPQAWNTMLGTRWVLRHGL